MTKHRCDGCGGEKESERLPRNWKQVIGKTYCVACKDSLFSCRAVTFRVASPYGVRTGSEEAPLDWATLNAAVNEQLMEATCLANWAVARLCEADPERRPGDTKLGKMPKTYLYPQAVAMFPRMSPATVAMTLNNVQSKYVRERLKTRWDFSASVVSFRFPQPVSLPAVAWSASLVERERGAGSYPVVGVKLLPRGADSRFAPWYLLRLKGGEKCRRQMDVFRRVCNGELKTGELKVIRDGKDILLSMSVWFPNEPVSTEAGNTMLVSTDPNAMWVVQVNDRKPWLWNGDDIRRTVAGSRVKPTSLKAPAVRDLVADRAALNQRAAEDRKFERRVLRWKKRNSNAAGKERAEKYDRRLDSFCHEATASLVGYAVRQGVKEVVYDDHVRSYIESFRYFELKTKLKEKLERVGIRFIVKNEAE